MVTSKKLKIAVAIPTFNRLGKLKSAIASIEQQEFDRDKIELICCLSNSASSDGTTEYIASLRSDVIKFVSYNQIVLTGDDIAKDSGIHNRIRLSEIIPPEVEWVWFMGDDDYFTRKSSIACLANVLQKAGDSRISICHVSQARRSRSSGKVIQGNLLDLCNGIGFHEMLGWMSSLVIRSDIFKSYAPVMQRFPKSAYAHSGAFLELAADQQALFVDMPWVDTQDNYQTEESIKRWTAENMGERYFYVVDGIISQFERGVLTGKLKPAFWRYHTYSLWDRYAAFLIGRAVNTGMLDETDLGHWERIRKIADTLDDPVFAKLFLSWHGSLSKQIRDTLKMQKVLLEAKRELVDYFNQTNVGCYPMVELLEGL